MKKTTITKALIAIMLVTSLSGCSIFNKFNLTSDQAKSDLNGQVISSFFTSVTLNSDQIKEITIKDQTVEDKTAKVIATINYEFVQKRKGKLNSDGVLNDAVYNYTGDIILNYTKYDKEWRLSSIENFDKLQETLTDRESLLERIPFKSDDEVIEDLKSDTDYVVLDAVYDYGAQYPYFADISLKGKYDSSTITKTNEVKVLSVEDYENKDTQKIVTIHVDVDFKSDGDVIFPNGEYNAAGDIKVIYKLSEDKDGKSYWDFLSVDNSNKTLTTTKK